VSDRDAEATVRAALAAGITYLDTAPHYGLGVAERRLGRVLAGLPRDGFVLSTKVGRLVRPLQGVTGRRRRRAGGAATPRW
jgi:D-threo-aldose 1-dehydrogenase